MTSASGNGGSQPGSQPDSQEEIIRLLSDPAVFGPEYVPGVDTVDRVETHVSLVFLGPGRAYKLKRAVTFPYLDFSTPEKRRLACEAEVRINRRTAPSIYLGVVAKASLNSMASKRVGRPSTMQILRKCRSP